MAREERLGGPPRAASIRHLALADNYLAQNKKGMARKDLERLREYRRTRCRVARTIS